MKKGSVLVEQVLTDGTVVKDYDESLSTSELFSKLEKYFPNIRRDSGSKLIIGEYKGNKYSIRCKNITYLGIPHPIYKKRIQISNDLVDFYKASKELGATPLLIGVYSHGDNTIFVEFGIDTYIEKKAHNSSAHVYTNDLMDAAIEGFFQKTDYFKNRITVFRSDLVNTFLDTIFSDNFTVEERISPSIPVVTVPVVTPTAPVVTPVIPSAKTSEKSLTGVVKDFFRNEKRLWKGTNCYQEMFDNDFRCKGQPEWVGAYLEYRFEKYINDNNLSGLISFYQDRSRGGIDLDLYFPQINSYGDLKAHSVESRGIPGNDWETIMNIVKDPNNHVYYIICEHAINRDRDFDYEVTMFWNTLLKKDNLYSYKDKMKHDATLLRAYILDINSTNVEYLSKFRQGINSNGKPRPPKIMIDDKYLDKFIIEKIEL